MQIQTRKEGDAIVLSLKGKITIGAGDVAMRDAIQQALDAGENKIVIEMSGITMIDSLSIGELVHAYTTTTNHGGKLKLCHLTAKVIDILTVTQLITVFDIYDTESEALVSFE